MRVRPWAILAAILASAILASATTAADPPSSAATFDLVTENEAATWNADQPKEPKDFSTRDLREDDSAPTCHSTPDNDADNPKIRILAPPLGRSLTAPLDFSVLFVPTSSAPIRPDTFRVCYVGSITTDLTKRITDRATVSEKGLRVTGVQLPRGRHHLVLLIADEHGRLGRGEAVLDIY
jgi:hypothetical protein